MRFGAVIVLCLCLPGLAEASTEAPCPEKFATVAELETCLNDDGCDLRAKFPEEMRRRSWANKAAENHIVMRLTNEAECVSMQSLLDGFEASISVCHPDEVFNSISAMLWKLKNRDKKVASNKSMIRPKTLFTLADKGTCK